jgi:hypothetical protein
MPRWLHGLGAPAAEAQIPCPDVPGVEQACQVATAIPNGAINAVGDAASAGIGAGVRAIFDGMTHWVVAGAKELVSQLSGWIDSSTRPDVASGWFSDSYTAMVKVGLAFVLPMLLLACIQRLVHQDLAGLGRTVVVHLPVACIGMVAATTVVDLLVSITDNFSAFVGSAIGGHGERFGQGLTKALLAIDGIPGLGFAVFLIALVLALLTLVLWAELVLRQAAVLITTLFLPLGFAGLVWEPASRWLRRLGEVVFALVLSKLVITAILSAGGAALDSASEGFGQVIVGLAIVALAAFAPYAIFRFIPLGEIGAVAALEGMRSRPARAATSGPITYATTSMLRSKIASSGASGGSGGSAVGGGQAPGGGGGAAAGAGAAGPAAGGTAVTLAAASGARQSARRGVDATNAVAGPRTNGASASGSAAGQPGPADPTPPASRGAPGPQAPKADGGGSGSTGPAGPAQPS